jgi:hypothetical protein
LFRSLDAYGHPIKLNFENDGLIGTTYQTFVGSACTILWLVISLGLFGAAMGSAGGSDIVAKYVSSSLFSSSQEQKLVLSGRNA